MDGLLFLFLVACQVFQGQLKYFLHFLWLVKPTCYSTQVVCLELSLQHHCTSTHLISVLLVASCLVLGVLWGFLFVNRFSFCMLLVLSLLFLCVKWVKYLMEDLPLCLMGQMNKWMALPVLQMLHIVLAYWLFPEQGSTRLFSTRKLLFLSQRGQLLWW